jgi:hypothetical protein
MRPEGGKARGYASHLLGSGGGGKGQLMSSAGVFSPQVLPRSVLSIKGVLNNNTAIWKKQHGGTNRCTEKRYSLSLSGFPGSCYAGTGRKTLVLYYVS